MRNAPSASVPSVRRRAPGGGGAKTSSKDEQEGILKDLEVILADNSSLYLSLGPEEAVVAMNKSPLVYAFGDSRSASRWLFMSPRERALWVTRVLRKAAAYSRRPKLRPIPEPSWIQAAAG